jgi:hypothetical protein
VFPNKRGNPDSENDAIVKRVAELAHDLLQAFPGMTGFGARNLKYMRALAEAYPDQQFVQQVVAQL